MNGLQFSGPAAKALTAAAVLALLVTACSLGGSPGTPALSKGVITAKGSVFVNGVEYADTAASISVADTANHTDSDLKVGMVVDVRGTINGSSGRGEASEILYAAELQGTIDAAPNTLTGVFFVFGHKVATDTTTVFDGVANLAGLAAGDRVEVSGTPDAAAGVLNASRVEKQAPGGDFGVKGVVSGLGSGSFTLTSSDGTTLTVNFSGALQAGIVNGSLVIVKFSAYTSPLTVTADKVHLITEPKAENGEHAEVSGVVSGFVGGSPSTFTVDGVTVSADNSLVAGVANGVRVEVRGTMQGSVLVAISVKTETESNIEAKGQVTAVDSTAGTLVLDGVVFIVTPRTIFRDDRTTGSLPFNLLNIMVTNTLEVHGFTDPSTGAIVAAKIEVQGGPGETVLSAPVTAVGTSTLTMAGVTVDVSGLPASARAVLLAVSIGTDVTVKGSVIGTAFTAAQGSIGG